MTFATGWDKFLGNATLSPITTDITIAVIDSGVRISHQDLDGNLWVNTGETNNNNIDDDSNGKIDDYNGWNFEDPTAENPNPQTWTGYSGEEGHGTHVSGIIAAEGNNGQGTIGVMSSHGKIMGLNVFGNQPSATTTDIDNAITYAVNEGANVINMSLGGTVFSATTQTAITNAVAAGLVVVAAAGNGDSQGYGLVLTSSYGVYPASLAKDINGMLSVGSFDALTGARSVFSNCSTTYVEISGPGAYDSTNSVNGGIPSTWHTSDSAYVKQLGGYAIYGTSMSSPMVAGAAGLAMSLYADQHGGTKPTPAVVETALTSSGATVTALSSHVKGGKILDLNALWTYIDAL
jgi:Subtilase family